MLYTNCTVTINGENSIIDKPVILYRGDKEIEIKFYIMQSKFYQSVVTKTTNVVSDVDASFSQLIVRIPEREPIFSEVTPVKADGAIVFKFTADMIDEITEVGSYDFQIRLLDENKTSRATIPPVIEGIKVKEPIAMEDEPIVTNDSNEVNVAQVNEAVITTATPLHAFDEQGNYIETTWTDKMLITDAKLNKIEDGIQGVNEKVNNIPTANTANDISIQDTAGNFTATNVEGALAELFQYVNTVAEELRQISSGGTGEQPLYKFGLLSDTHVDGDGTDETHSISDLTNALSFLEGAGANFIAYCGDMTYNGRNEDYTALKTCLETSTVPNYCVRGNHDAYSLADGYASATGCKDDYIITQNNDLLIFISCADTNHDTGGLTTAKLDWLESLLQTNTNTRVFLFYHYFVEGTSGNAGGNYPWGSLNPSNAIALRFINMIKQYPNLIFCNGHSHIRFNLQDQYPNANYYHNNGECYYIHVPSGAKPRYLSGDSVADYYEGSEGYLVEVYANKVIFKPIDFIASEYLTKYNYTANVSQGNNTPTVPSVPDTPSTIDIAWNDGVKIDRSTGAETSSAEYSASNFIACDTSKTYTLNWDSSVSANNSNVFACYYDESQSFISCGDNYVGSYHQSLDVYTTDLSLPSNAKYIKLRLYAVTDASAMDKSIITLTTTGSTSSSPEGSSEVITPTWETGDIGGGNGQDVSSATLMRTNHMEFNTNSYTYYITASEEFEGIDNIKVYFYDTNGNFNSRIIYEGLTAGVAGEITFPIATGKFRIKVDFMTSNTLENINNRLVITRVAK